MGQKVNPHGARVGVIKDWSTRWYADKKNFADNLVSDAKLRKMISKLNPSLVIVAQNHDLNYYFGCGTHSDF